MVPGLLNLTNPVVRDLHRSMDKNHSFPPHNLPPIDVPGLLRAYHLKPNKRLGQNFLMDDTILARIVSVAQVSSRNQILEVGPGLGSLTRHLALAAQRVIAVELDSNLIPILQQVVAPYENVTIYQGDILELDPTNLISATGYLVVANIPYYITSALIRHLLESSHKPARLVLTVQREVAQRITAEPGEMSLLSLSVQVYGQPQVVMRIPAGAFYPSPQVDSSVVRVDLYSQPRISSENLGVFFRLIKAGFSQKRKTLRNALSGGLHLPPPQIESLLRSAEIDPRRRAETLSFEEWDSLVQVFNATTGIS
jgi:16S rRNA (adenine1518-N6/adenine1519-N6)-dimethyltransferase